MYPLYYLSLNLSDFGFVQARSYFRKWNKLHPLRYKFMCFFTIKLVESYFYEQTLERTTLEIFTTLLPQLSGDRHIARIRELAKNEKVRVVFAHDANWYEENKGGSAFWPGKIESK